MEAKIKVQRKIKLPNNIIEALSNIPETGMGFHKVHFILEDGHITRNECILNSEYLLIDMIEYEDIFAKKSEEEITEMLNKVVGIYTTDDLLKTRSMISVKR